MRADIHDGPEQNSSKQRPDTLMQDRSYQIDETSCNARPDHTSGSFASISPCPLSTIPDITTTVPRRICEQPVRRPRLLHPCLGRFGEHDARAIEPRVATTTAMNLRDVCCLGGFALAFA